MYPGKIRSIGDAQVFFLISVVGKMTIEHVAYRRQ